LDSKFFLYHKNHIKIKIKKINKKIWSDEKMVINMDFSVFRIYWEQFLNWFLEIPLPGQILMIVGIIAILTLVCVGVYYLLKGVAYLVYYVLKGVGYLIFYIFKGIYLLFEGLYNLISGKEKPLKQAEVPELEIVAQEIPKQVVPMKKEVQVNAFFCSQCGTKYSETMIHQLDTQGRAFCIHCGEGLTANPIEVAI
jgi:hypothetical protein